MNSNKENIDNNVNQNETTKNEVEINETTGLEEIIIEEDGVTLEEESKVEKKNEKNNSFILSLLASTLDQIFCSGISIIILFIISLMLPTLGYRLVLIGKYSLFIIIYLITNIVYYPVINRTKLKNTIGKSLLKI